jgi:hypothetical protein
MTDDHTPDRERERFAERSDATDPAVIAASAFVDGEASQTEQQLVENDAAVRRLSEQFALIAEQVSNVEPADTDAVESALAAALGAFDQADAAGQDAAGAPAPLSTLLITTAPPLRPRADSAMRGGAPARARDRRSGQLLKIAAAVLVIGALGVVASNLRSGDSTEQLSDAAPARLESTEADSSEESTEDADEPMALAESSADGGDTDVASDALDQGAQMGTFEVDDDADGSSPDWTGANLMMFDGPDDLAGFARSMVDARAAAGSNEAWSTRLSSECLEPQSLILGPALYIGNEAILVLRDIEQTSYVQAIDAATCAVLAQVPL